MIEDNFYVYLHIIETEGLPFYVGKGKNKRAYNSNGRNNYWRNKVNKYGFDVIFLEENITEEEAFKLEIYWINRIGRKDLGNGPLVNLCDGGDGVSGRIYTEEEKKQMSQKTKGRILTEDHKNNISKSRIGIEPWNKGIKRDRDYLEKHKIFVDILAKERTRKIKQIDLNGFVVKEWNSSKEASIFFNVTTSSIRKVLCGKHKTASGFKWEYSSEKYIAIKNRNK